MRTSETPHDDEASPRRSLVDILVERGLLDEDALARARARRRDTGRSLARALLELDLVGESDVVSALAEQVGMPFVDLDADAIDLDVTRVLPAGIARRYVAVPIEDDGRTLCVATTDPGNTYALDVIARMTGREVRPLIATRTAILDAIARAWPDDADSRDDAATVAVLGDAADDAPIVKLATLLLRQAVADGASEVFVEPEPREVVVRYVVGGVLQELLRSPKAIHAALLTRIKTLACMDPDDRTRPQQGRVGVVVGGKSVDLRVATAATPHGEMAHLRLIRRSDAAPAG